MRGDFDMVHTVLALTAFCGFALGSLEHGVGVSVLPVASQSLPVPPPVVTAASSQYFERTFNRLVIPQALEPVVPVAPAPPVVRVTPSPPVFIQPSNVIPVQPPQPNAVQPNVAIAIATAHAAAPVATFLLPPYPFGVPSTIGFIPSTPPINVPDESRKESTTKSTTTVEVRTTTQQPEETTLSPQASNSDNSFVRQALPSNENVNFRLYGPPPQFPQQKPQKYKTSVEVVPVPLTYIMPPPLPKLQAVKTIKHIHTYVPAKAKITIRPVRLVSPAKIRKVRVPSRLVYRAPLTARVGGGPLRGPAGRDIEPTTFRPSIKPFTKPPRV